MFAKLNPAGAAGGEHRQFALALNPLYQLMCFFNNGKVSGDVHVEDAVYTQTANCGHHLSFYIGADGQVKTFAKRSANGGRGEEHNFLLRVADGIPHLVDLAFFA